LVLFVVTGPLSLLRVSIIQFFSHYRSPTRFYPLSLHDALPISHVGECYPRCRGKDHWDVRAYASVTGIGAREYRVVRGTSTTRRSEEHTSELQSLRHLVCRLLLEKKKYSADRE